MSTYTPIASQTLDSAVSSVTFSSIPQTYTDLVVVCNIVGTPNTYMLVTLNGDSGSNYSRTVLVGTGSAANSYRSSNTTSIDTGFYFSNSSSNAIFNFNNYSNTTTFKTALVRGNTINYEVAAGAYLWRNTNAITTITFSGTANYAAGSTFNLYGIASASAIAKASGGNIVTTDGTYFYHTFTSSGTFTPLQALTADYLVVAGGGGGGSNINTFNGGTGGGGAGGLRCTVGATGGGGSLETPLSLTAQAYTVTVGAGGAGTTAGTPATGSNGSNSVFSSITSTGGGGGGKSGTSGTAGTIGGSGGGSSSANGTLTVGAAGTANQGYAGGDSNGTGSYGGGGGGGAGAVGGNGNGSTGGNGGNGVTTSINGVSTTYAGGGGGGSYNGTTTTGGTGGGANGIGAGTAGAGTANTGGGGGGAGATGGAGQGGGGAGGSGIVIVRYAV